MICGVIGFSISTGTLTSIMSNLDSANAILKEKLNTLDEIKKDYDIGPVLYEEIRQSLTFEIGYDKTAIFNFMETLPHRLKVELSVKIHHQMIMQIPFFEGWSKQFIAFIGPLLKPKKCKEDTYVFEKGDEVKAVFFLIDGIAGFVLPEKKNLIFSTVEKGDYLGLMDLIPDKSEVVNG